MRRTAIGALLLALACAAPGARAAEAFVRGVSLTELDAHRYDASEGSAPKTEAQGIVDQLFERGVRHVVLTPRAVMYHPRKSELTPMTPPPERAGERRAYLRLIKYIHGKGMTVGMRPIFFVVDDRGKTPYVETLPDGSKLNWWHGNILPESPNVWFESLKTYYDIYLPIARYGQVEEFTLGAELYTMTVGIEDHRYYREMPEDPAAIARFQYGFPAQWRGLLAYVRAKVAPTCRIMYDINFTDDKISAAGVAEQFGGEFARWKYRLVDLARPSDPVQKQVWENLLAFWKGLDAVGIDMYRSLAADQAIPSRHGDLVSLLKLTSDRYASQIDNALFEIEGVAEARKKVVLKEIGFRSVEKGFVDPFLYVGSDRGAVSLGHQAAAYEAIFRSFWEPKWDWFGGIVFWDASVDSRLHGERDTGFSFIGKAPTEAVVKQYFRD